MRRRQLLGLTGSLLLIVGAFLPIVTVPLVGTMNYFGNDNRTGDGVILVVLAVISIVLVLMRSYKGLWFAGLISLSLLVWTFSRPRRVLDIGDDVGEIGRRIADSIHVEWGRAVIGLGVLLVAAASRGAARSAPARVSVV